MKIVRAKCAKTNKLLCLQVSDDGTVIKGCFKVADADFETMPSQIRIAPNATVANTYCETCSSSKAFGCEHPYQKAGCRGTTTAQNKQCLLCKHLVPDYKKSKAGGEIQLKAGEVAEIELSKIKVGLNWGEGIDLDCSVVMVRRGGGSELVYFGHLDSEDRSVHHRGDNLTGRAGAVAGAEDKENMDILLDRVNADFDRLVFVINVFTAGSTFRNVRDLSVVLYDADTGERLISYKVEGQSGYDSSMVIGQASRTGSTWEFKAIGQTQNMNVHELNTYCSRTRW